MKVQHVTTQPNELSRLCEKAWKIFNLVELVIVHTTSHLPFIAPVKLLQHYHHIPLVMITPS